MGIGGPSQSDTGIDPSATFPGSSEPGATLRQTPFPVQIEAELVCDAWPSRYHCSGLDGHKPTDHNQHFSTVLGGSMSSSAARYLPARFGGRAVSPAASIEEAVASATEAEKAKAAARLDSISDAAKTVVDDFRFPAGPSDEVLMGCIARGDKEALASLFRRYAQKVRGVALRILRNTSEADDLLQEVFLFIYRKSALFDPS